MRKLLALCTFSILTNILLSQNIYLDSIEINATQISTTTKECGKSTRIILSKEIQKLPVNSVDQLLRYIGGVNINSRNGFGVQSDIGMRGSTYAQVLILIDYVRLNDPLTAHFNSNFPVALADIDHIEIIRGAASVSFGADAVGGVIHIKTKTFVNNQKRSVVSSIGSIGIGSHNTLLTDIGINGSTEKLAYSLSAKTAKSEGESLLNPNFVIGVSADSLYNTNFDINTINGALNFRINHLWSAFAHLGYDTRKFNAKYYYTQSTYDESSESTQSLWSHVALTRKKESNRTMFSLAYKETDDEFIFNPLFSSNVHNTRLTNLFFNHTGAIHSRINFALGANYLLQHISSNDRGNHHKSSFAVFSVFDIHISNSLKSTIGFRLQQDSNFGMAFIPQLNLSYTANAFVLRSSIGQGIRAADFTERYVSSTIKNLSPGRNIGNPDLKEEKSFNADLGVDYYYQEQSKISFSGFYRGSTNLIDFVVTNSNDIHNAPNLIPNSNYFYTKNVSRTKVYGVELSSRQSILLSSVQQLFLDLEYTYLHTSNNEKNSTKYEANHPAHAINLNVDYQFKNFHLNVNSGFFHKDNTGIKDSPYFFISDNYTVTDTKFGLDFLNKRLQAYLLVKNVFNTEYQEILGAKMPSRWLIFGVAWTIE